MSGTKVIPEPGQPQCPQCGTPLPSGSLAGLCPACLLKMGAAADTVTEGKQPFTPPSVAELAPLFPQLEILELIGKGGMGAVYKARQKQLDRIVALKILPPGIGHDAAFAERFAREAKALAKLNHPGIVTLYEFGVAPGILPAVSRNLSGQPGGESGANREALESSDAVASSSAGPGGRMPPSTSGKMPDATTTPPGSRPSTFDPRQSIYFFLMEFVDGVNLRQLLHAGRISAREALAIVPQICDALQFAHDQGIVHRDIKPENILLDRRGRVKVADFGLAKIVGTDAPLTPSLSPSDGERVAKPGEGTPALTDAGKVMGTPQYMSPEQRDNPGEVDHRADIYALGVVFYQMLTGELPGKKIEPPSKKVSIDVRLDEVVLRALEKKPELRYQQASALKTQVENLSHGYADVGWKSPDSDWGWLVGRMFGVTFTTPMTCWLANASGLGFLGFLGLIPGGRALFAFFGFFGLAGLALAMEFSRRNKAAIHAADQAVPRFSRLASVGGAWAAFAGLVFSLQQVGISAEAVFLIPEKILTALTLSAPLATTILGWVAVTQIRRSAGKLHGMWLAVFDGLLFPLLAVDAAIFALGYWAARLLSKLPYFSPSGDGSFGGGIALGYQIALVLFIWLAGSTVVSVLADVVLIRRVWRAVKSPSDGGAMQTPRAPRRAGRSVWAGAFAMTIALLGVGAAAFLSMRNASPNDIASLVNQPHKLRSLPTATVIQVGLAEPKSGWAWQELEKRARKGMLEHHEMLQIVDGFTAWMRREHPEGYNQPLVWFDNLLDELHTRYLVGKTAGETNALAFLDAYYGSPSLDPLPRARENASLLQLTCQWRSSWLNQHSLGFELLNEMRSISVDGVQVPVQDGWRKGRWNDQSFTAALKLPTLAPGKHVVRCEIESAFVPTSDMAGLAEDAMSSDWPPVKRRWTRSCEAEFIVYAADAEIVSLTDDPALNPVAGGALSARPIIIRPERGRMMATVSFNTDAKPGLPISVDVTLRLAGQTLRCGKLFSVKTAKRGSSGPQELTVEIEPLDGQIKEAEILLTPNPKAIEEYPYVDRIWGKEIVFSHVPLSRQDLYGTKPVVSVTATPPTASTETWSPLLASSEKPDPNKILEEARSLVTQKGRYEDALQRFIWYHNHAQQLDTNLTSGWLISALSDWIELGRRYPKARQALIEIRDSKNREFAEGRGYFELFMEAATVNQYLRDDEATYALFKRIEKQDAGLADGCYYAAQSELMKHGEYESCLRYLKGSQARFAIIRDSLERQRTMEQNLAQAYQRMGQTNAPVFSQSQRKIWEDYFVKETRTLIEICVGAGRKTEAEKIQAQAVSALNVPELQSAVSDAEEKMRSRLVPPEKK